jgi:hypothetical protein
MLGPTLLGLLVRLRYLLAGGGFPLGDGGLFTQMIHDLQRAHYVLPSTTTFNGAGIPFDYPPLGLYITGTLSDVTHLPLLTTVAVLPVIVSALTIGALALLAREFFVSQRTALAATIAFAVTPLGFWHEIMGGGITRSFGLLFAVLALWQLLRVYRTRSRCCLAGAGLCAGLTVLSHPAFPLFIVDGACVFLLCGEGRLRRLRDTAATAVVALVVIAPWIAPMIARHGVGPYVSALTGASGFGAGLTALIEFALPHELFFPVIAALALIGAVASLVRRRTLLVWWLLLCCTLNWRGGLMYCSVPLALLAGVGVGEVVLPRLARLGLFEASRVTNRIEVSLLPPSQGWLRGLRWALIGALVTYPVLGSALLPWSYLGALPSSERAAMAWASRNTAPQSRFLVIGADQARSDSEWPSAAERSIEWFPALAQRTSVTTTEGLEWMPGYVDAVQEHDQALNCVDHDVSCIEDWAAQYHVSFTYVFLPKGDGVEAVAAWCCDVLRQSLRADPRYVIVYDGPGATIAARRSVQ